MNGDIEYILQVWREIPEDSKYSPVDCWEAHVQNAPAIPKIGEAIDSSGFDAFSRYRIFDVRHQIGGALAELTTESRSKLKTTTVPEGNEGLIHVLAYQE